jgi:hypothetical protein
LHSCTRQWSLPRLTLQQTNGETAVDLGPDKIAEFTADVPALTQEELDRVAELYERNFDVVGSDDHTKIGA